MDTNSLPMFARSFYNNVSEIPKVFPELYYAAEGINNGFDTLFSIVASNKNIVSNVLKKMSFGSHVSWITAYLLTSAGYKTSGLGESRRSIEFVCYASKINNNKQRANAWIDQGEDSEARRKFSLQCSIPKCYKSKKYKFLWPLLLIHNEANYYGSHGNFESVIYNYTEQNNGNMKFHFQMNEEYVKYSLGEIIIVGLRILQAYKYIIENNKQISESKEFSEVMNFAENQVKTARIELAVDEYNGIVPASVYENIKEDNQEIVYELFKEMLEREGY